METKRTRRRELAVAMIVIFVMLIAITFCVRMTRNIHRQMNESATSNLRNTTQVIESTLENFIHQDWADLNVVGGFYTAGTALDTRQMERLCDAMGFERMVVVDAQGQPLPPYAGTFQPADLPFAAQWTPGEQGYSDAYVGPGGRLQTTLWLPLYQGEEYLGTVFGDTILSKYYSPSIFTFYQGEGRTYLFDGSDGTWILRSMGTDGASRRQDDIYSLLLSSGNDAGQVQEFRQAVEGRQTGTAVFDFNGRQSYICFMPLTSSPDWYLLTVIANDTLLKESAQVQGMIRLTLVVVSVALLFFAGVFSLWQRGRAKQQEISYREALFTNLSSNIDSAFLIYEKDQRQTAFVSENVGRLLGLDRELLRADAAHLFDWCGLPPEDPERTAFLEGTLDRPTLREVCAEDELGERARHIRLELIPADLGQEIAVLTDITKDKDIQASLLDAMRQAEAASHAKDDFLSAMSHDIRTPMNGIVGMTAIAAAHLDEPDRVRACLGKISDASAHLLTIINEVLDMSQIESGRVELAQDPFNLAQLLQEVLGLNYPGLQQKEHTFHVRVHAMEHEQVVGDPARLQRLATNLISNAIKYTPPGGTITLELWERPSSIKGYGRYELMVQDNGIGMTQEFQKKLFQPFEREEDVRISRIQGTGLGMSIAKNLAELMMGDIQVESEKHKGTTLRVTFHLQLDEEDHPSLETLCRLPVLVVDDDHATCEVVTGMLTGIGLASEWVDNGPQAVELVARRHREGADFMAVLLDWKMPGMDGIETARRIRAAVGDLLPVIFLTAYDWTEIESQARQAGVNDFLSKPLYKAKLRSKLEALATAPEGPVPPPPSTGDGAFPGRRVLLVEDNDLNQEIALEILTSLQLEVDCAEDGVAAVERFSQSAPGTYQLIFMDIQMPRMNGYDAAKAIRALDRPDSRSVPIVAMTADAFVKDIQAARAVGMDDHLSKPISMIRLKQVLSQFLSRPGDSSDQKGDAT